MLFEMTVAPFIKTLQNLSHVLDKGAAFAETKKIDVGVLLNSRLAPDQFNLIRQIQIACDTAKLGVARLTGKDAPVNEDNEKTLSELKTRIESTITYLNKFTAQDFEGAETRRITNKYWGEGNSLNGKDYVLHFALPNVYFHVTTAYSILRHNGVEIGKLDYLGPLPFNK